MNKAARLFAVLGLVLACVLAATPAMASSSKSIVGSWTASVDTLGISGLFTFNQEGTMTASATNQSFSGSHGVWSKTGSRRYFVKQISFVFGATGVAESIWESEFEFNIDSSGDSATTEIVVTIKQLDGTVISTFSGTGTAERIEID